ncbi:MAG: hypothetical protein ACT4QG_02260 [Sporichthyaceae bacterium]
MDYGPWDGFHGGFGGFGSGKGFGYGFFDAELGGGPLIGYLYRPFKPWFD